MKRAIALLGLVLLGFLATACNEKTVSSASDTHVCVYHGDEKKGKALKFQLPPGAEPRKTDRDDEVVKIPASNRFYMASKNREIADVGAPEYYLGFAEGGTRVQVQGQVRFRFNLDNACDWYAKHGRRNADNGDLGFNARGGSSGWIKFLNENFGVTMNDVVSERTNPYPWPLLVYNYPRNATEGGTVPKGEKVGPATRQVYGEDLGRVFTQRLEANLGGKYFCGIEVTQDTDPCPPMKFQVINVETAKPQLMEQRDSTELLKQELAERQREADIRFREQKTLLAAERQKQRLLREQAKTERLRVNADPYVQRCVRLARVGLDCNGQSRRAPIIMRQFNDSTLPPPPEDEEQPPEDE